MSSRPFAVDLFAGVGGMSLGFEQAGFDVACAVEVDAVHCAAHLYNFPRTSVINDGVENVTGNRIRESSRIGNGKVAVVFGGSPCQGFSMIGKRSLDDPRNALVSHFMRLVTELDADHFVLENVKGLTVGKHRKFLDEIVEGFDAAGYDVVMPWQVLNACWFGVPQSRDRLFIMGAKKGLSLPQYPKRVFNGPQRKDWLEGLPVGPTVADALGDLPDADNFAELVDSDTVAAELGDPSSYAAILRGIVRDPFDLAPIRPVDNKRLTSSTRSMHNAVTRERFSNTEPGKVEPVSRFLRLHPEGISNTLRAGTGSDRGSYTAARPIHPNYPRCITVREMARLHSYPDWFRFNWTKWHGAREVGNSVPPLLARAVASKVLEAGGYCVRRQNEVAVLGDPDLLRVDPSSAPSMVAKYAAKIVDRTESLLHAF